MTLPVMTSSLMTECMNIGEEAKMKAFCVLVCHSLVSRKHFKWNFYLTSASFLMCGVVCSSSAILVFIILDRIPGGLVAENDQLTPYYTSQANL